MNWRKKIILLLALLLAFAATPHPMPHSLLLLNVKENGISATLSLPLKEFQMVFPNEDLDNGYNTLIQRKDNWLNNYLLQHLHITDPQGKPWTISIRGKNVSESEQPLTGKYHELSFDLWLQPPANETPRNFVMYYDAILHQLVTHKLFIKIAKDWDGGLMEKDSVQSDLGILSVKTSDGSIPPVTINLDHGSKWKGFKAMFNLGMEHIAEGTDHLLFLLVLMLSAPLIATNGRWSKGGGTKYSVIRLVKIATAFTIGHSLTLLAGAIGWLRLPSQPVELLIAISILISAVHAIKPLFYGKEILVACSFGLIHGLAFASTLSGLDLDGTRMALSILGFNLGIEAMQFFIILLVVPWLVILSGSTFYKYIRMVGSMAAIVASVGWIVERISGNSNVVVEMTEQAFDSGRYIILALVLGSGIYFVLQKRNPQAS